MLLPIVLSLFVSSHNIPKYNNAVLLANRIAANPIFYMMIGNVPRYSHIEANPRQVREDLKFILSHISIDPFIYYTTTEEDEYDDVAFAVPIEGSVHINARYLSSHTCSIVNSLIHEAVHLSGYHHGDNDYYLKDDSVPYKVGEIAEEICISFRSSLK